MALAVLLLHELPDGSNHFDWLIQRTGGVDAPLISFRVGERIDGDGACAFAAARLTDHRPAYLTYQGKVSGGRGRVKRVAEGELKVIKDNEGRFVAVGRLGAAHGTFRGVKGENGIWRFAFAPEAGVVHCGL